MEAKFTYLLLNLFTISYPLAQSFEWRLTYYKSWYALFPAMLLTGIFFIVWDVLKTWYGVWSFNPEYLIGINIINLPLEEWLFFVTVPYACVFIYEVMNYYVKKDVFGNISKQISLILGIFILVSGLLNNDKAYTFVMFSLQGIYLILMSLYFKPKWFGRFFLAYLVSLIPFGLVNGILTALPVVIYNNAENLGIRLYTIPIEDTMYSMMLMMMNIHLYEFFKSKSLKKHLRINSY
ncbi:MAG: lycopene cyclase domain-containing protein [Candidatus Kapabacteria bacterium]|nr:lycopene cyclase domain-containing protein [Ignavibacteriota bacterium]MCW5883683.1 lycopene cyclase domain-containing protein [Candidatus Kapabacteria bacterium]